MINDRLKQLGKYAEELEKEDPLDLLNNYFNQISEELRNFSDNNTNLRNDFRNDVKKVINKYNSKNLIPSTVSIELFYFLINHVKQTMIANKANYLGIDKNLYKNDMKFLFKGRK